MPMPQRVLYNNVTNQQLHIYKYFNHILLYYLVKKNNMLFKVFKTVQFLSHHTVST